MTHGGEPDRAFAEGVIASCAARGVSLEKLITRLLLKGAKEVIDSSDRRQVDRVELVRRLLFRDRLANGYTDRRGHGAFGVQRMDESDGGITLNWWDGRVLDYSCDRGPINRWMLDGMRITRTEAELQLGLWPGFLDGVELCEQNLSRLRKAAAKEAECEMARAVEEMKQENRAQRHQLLAMWRNNGVAPHTGQTPATIRHIRAIKRFDGVIACHVYFLLQADEVVYVGQSGAAWPHRLH